MNYSPSWILVSVAVSSHTTSLFGISCKKFVTVSTFVPYVSYRILIGCVHSHIRPALARSQKIATPRQMVQTARAIREGNHSRNLGNVFFWGSVVKALLSAHVTMWRWQPWWFAAFMFNPSPLLDSLALHTGWLHKGGWRNKTYSAVKLCTGWHIRSGCSPGFVDIGAKVTLSLCFEIWCQLNLGINPMCHHRWPTGAEMCPSTKIGANESERWTDQNEVYITKFCCAIFEICQPWYPTKNVWKPYL